MDQKGPLTGTPACRSKIECHVAITRKSLHIACEICSIEIRAGGVNISLNSGTSWTILHFLPSHSTDGSQKPQVLVIIEHQVLARTCILSILKRELAGLEIVEMATTSGLNWLSGRDVRLIALNIGNKEITEPSIGDDLARLAEFCPNAYVALLSNRDDEATASAAMQRGVRGFFPTSIPVELAIAGLRLVLAGGVYRPLPVMRQEEASSPKTISADTGAPELPAIHEGNRATRIVPEKSMIDLTPREQQVLAALKLGLPNKLIAVKLNLSENTVKMHIQHIMRKCSAHNRTEAVLRWSERLTGHNGHARSRVPSSS